MSSTRSEIYLGVLYIANTYSGIIFDMDNTLVSSKIDFDKMKYEIYKYFRLKNIINCDLCIGKYSVSTLIKEAENSKKYNNKVNRIVWNIIEEFEREGMKDADLEPCVLEVLEKIYQNHILVVLTNNSMEAAITALKKNSIVGYFDDIVTRDHTNELKPSSDGVNYILRKYSDLLLKRWLLIGDSWIDGRAAMNGGINFIAYKADEEELREKKIITINNISCMKELLDYI